ncbi:low affinity iron permease family protein [Streptomyces sp. TLI_171]|uniref:low affinity iron permease family protein n=1 Tax=Streptomyces sp. TLI_171 TaxID=1938859 RepID=UPI000C18266C|nr:low affinity iron permease family protein [Streptomyces sp. TLI_171]RKE05135.1 low affinity Fe/Cu permease [Streptomyces sp. TLI_171]
MTVFPHPAERTGDGRGRFERLAETASNLSGSPAFSVFCLALVAGFAAVHALGLPTEWQLLAGDVMTAVTLVLLALLKNAERRAEHALQRKLDAIAAALLEQHAGDGDEAHRELRKAIRLDERL